MNKRDAVLSLLDETKQSPYIPAAFFLHFSPEFHAGQAAVQKHLEYYRATGMDFIKIQYERVFPPIVAIRTPDDWAKMPSYGKDFYEGQLKAVEGLVNAAKGEAIVIQTLYSPFMCAGHSTSGETITQHLKQDPEKVAKGLAIISDSLGEFVRECIRLGVDGFYMSTQGGEAGRFDDPAVFEQYIKPYDLALMVEINRACPFNILHVCDYQRDYDTFEPFLDYPGHVVNCPLKVGDRKLTPKEAAQMFKRPYMGGLERKGIISTGTPAQIRQEVESVLRQAPERFILGADCTVLSETPWANLKTAIDTAHAYKRQ
jgi:uroporphyrinogen decarboxylase